MELWIIATLLASTFQTLRFTLQKILSSDALSATGATFARFCYALPFLTVGLAVYFGMNAIAFPALNARLLVYAGVGGLTQIFATSCVLSMFKYRNFAVGITFKKTEVILVALVGFVLLGEGISALGFGAILLGLIGLLLLSKQPLSGQGDGSRWINRASALGLASGLLFAISGVCYRAASLELPYEQPFLRAAVSLFVVIVFQTCVMGVWMGLREPSQLRAVWHARKTALWVGVTGLLGSLGWFTAFTLQTAAYVKGLGQIELLFSLCVSILFFQERVSRREVFGILFLGLSVLGVIFAA